MKHCFSHLGADVLYGSHHVYTCYYWTTTGRLATATIGAFPSHLIETEFTGLRGD